MTSIRKSAGESIIIALAGILISAAVYRLAIVPALSTFATVPSAWWLIAAGPYLAALAAIALRGASRGDMIWRGAAVGATVLAADIAAALLRVPGSFKGGISDPSYWVVRPLALLLTSGAVLTGIYALRRGLASWQGQSD